MDGAIRTMAWDKIEKMCNGAEMKTKVFMQQKEKKNGGLAAYKFATPYRSCIVAWGIPLPFDAARSPWKTKTRHVRSSLGGR
jgi:hypothetical protein